MKRAMENRLGLASSFLQLSVIERDEKNLEQARRLLREAIELESNLRNRRGLASAMHQLGNIEYAEDNTGRARRLWERALRITRRIGHADRMAGNLKMLARLDAKLARVSHHRVSIENSK